MEISSASAGTGSSFTTPNLADCRSTTFIEVTLADSTGRIRGQIHTTMLAGPLLVALVSKKILMIKGGRDRYTKSSDTAVSSFDPFSRYSRKGSKIGVW